ncbi:MAG TPA: hypothetical protein VL614_27845 [Acetobacteraceae bacterium]|nr:hypothetical protein [Acetobacteraceae bacterium]
MEHAEPTSAVASPPDPAQDHPAPTLPHNIEVLLHAVGILLGYGRHLIDTVRHRATAPNFNAIAACFGTDNLPAIIAHLNRGILRAVALQRVLLARAATGKDIEFVERRTRPSQGEPAATEAQPGQHAAVLLPARRHAPRLSRPAGWNDPELFMPTLEDLERQARRRPIGRTIHDICLDLAVVPGFCHSAFWNELFDIMTYFGGSIATLMRQKARRRETFSNQLDRKPDANWDWLNMTRDALRQVLGFFIGEPPVNPLEPSAAIATGPP